jgi:hypothetical protein
MKILSIDAWAEPEGWTWNAWYHVGDISKEDFEKLKTDKQIAVWMEEHGFTTTSDMRRILIFDDGYNVVLCERKSRMPVFAIEYGPEY